MNFLADVKTASFELSSLDLATRNKIINTLADLLEKELAQIILENELDMTAARKANLSPALQDRLFLDEKRIRAICTSLRQIVALKDPLFRVLDGWKTIDNLEIQKLSVPIGVIYAIYESRPNVTIDIAALAIKSGNACILKGGKEALRSNTFLANLVTESLELCGVNKNSVYFVNSRETADDLLKQDEYIDLIIPRGSSELIKHVSQNSSIPVLKHDKGLCHIFVDESANFETALEIILNAKSRTGVCNAVESILVHNSIRAEFLPLLQEVLEKEHIEIRACARSKELIKAVAATEQDYKTEYLDKIVSLKVIDGVKDAVKHINTFGSGHSDAILTNSAQNAQLFTDTVNSACVYVNASTRFTDGFAFGFGAEVGISTNKLHARGPVGLNELTTYKYKIYGKNSIRN